MRRNKIILKGIKLIVYDFDGVLTDNRVILNEDGKESIVVNRSDGLAINMVKSIGIRQLILTTEKNKVVKARAQKLDIPFMQGIQNKKEALIIYCKQNKIPLEKVLYIGNDINDLEVMKIVGFPVCPSDAYKQIKEISSIILNVAGGAGVVRELIEYI